MPFTSAQRQALIALSRLWTDRAFALIGASALDFQLPLERATRDLDITIAIEQDEYPAGLESLEGWRPVANQAHRWQGPDHVYVDVLPAGPAIQEAGVLEWPTGARMNMTGFRHAFEQTISLELTPDQTVEVAALHVIVLLKMVAYLDRPLERADDLGDIARVVEYYVADDDDRRFSDAALDKGLDFEDVPSFLLGQALDGILNADERAIVDRFLDSLATERALNVLTVRGPRAWRRDGAIARRRIAALRSGLSETRP